MMRLIFSASQLLSMVVYHNVSQMQPVKRKKILPRLARGFAALALAKAAYVPQTRRYWKVAPKTLSWVTSVRPPPSALQRTLQVNYLYASL